MSRKEGRIRRDVGKKKKDNKIKEIFRDYLELNTCLLYRNKGV